MARRTYPSWLPVLVLDFWRRFLGHGGTRAEFFAVMAIPASTLDGWRRRLIDAAKLSWRRRATNRVRAVAVAAFSLATVVGVVISLLQPFVPMPLFGIKPPDDAALPLSASPAADLAVANADAWLRQLPFGLRKVLQNASAEEISAVLDAPIPDHITVLKMEACGFGEYEIVEAHVEPCPGKVARLKGAKEAIGRIIPCSDGLQIITGGD